MEKYSGPFSTKEEALTKAQESRDFQRNYLGEIRRHDADLAHELASKTPETDYLVLSDDELEEARRRGIRIY